MCSMSDQVSASNAHGVSKFSAVSVFKTSPSEPGVYLHQCISFCLLSVLLHATVPHSVPYPHVYLWLPGTPSVPRLDGRPHPRSVSLIWGG